MELSEEELTKEKSSKEALTYISGYLAKKLNKKYPEMLKMNAEGCDWIKIKSRGSLAYPSEDLVKSVNIYEEVFRTVHGNDLCREGDPIGKTIEEISRVDKRWPKEVIKLFVKLRFFHRLKLLNNELKARFKTKSTRTFKQSAQFLF